MASVICNFYTITSFLALLHWLNTLLLFSMEGVKVGILAYVLDVRRKTFKLSL